MKIILGSSSPWRKMILEKMGYQFEVMDPGVDERAIRNPNPSVLTTKLAMAKRDALLPKINEPAILITSDQVVTCNGEIREKPKDAEECRRFLQSYRKHTAKAVTAVLVRNTQTNWEGLVVDAAIILFQGLTDEAIEQLIAEGTVMNCAGGFAAGAPFFKPYVASIFGETESIMGLPRKIAEILIQDALNSKSV